MVGVHADGEPPPRAAAPWQAEDQAGRTSELLAGVALAVIGPYSLTMSFVSTRHEGRADSAQTG